MLLGEFQFDEIRNRQKSEIVITIENGGWKKGENRILDMISELVIIAVLGFWGLKDLCRQSACLYQKLFWRRVFFVTLKHPDSLGVVKFQGSSYKKSVNVTQLCTYLCKNERLFCHFRSITLTDLCTRGLSTGKMCCLRFLKSSFVTLKGNWCIFLYVNGTFWQKVSVGNSKPFTRSSSSSTCVFNKVSATINWDYYLNQGGSRYFEINKPVRAFIWSLILI